MRMGLLNFFRRAGMGVLWKSEIGAFFERIEREKRIIESDFYARQG